MAPNFLSYSHHPDISSIFKHNFNELINSPVIFLRAQNTIDEGSYTVSTHL